MITRIPAGQLRQSLGRSATVIRYNTTKAGPSKPAARPQRAYRNEDYDLVPDVDDPLSFGSGLGAARPSRAGSSRAQSYAKNAENIQPHLKYNQYAEHYEVDDKDLDDDPLFEVSDDVGSGHELSSSGLGYVLEDGVNDAATKTDAHGSGVRRIKFGTAASKRNSSDHRAQTTLSIKRTYVEYRSDSSKHFPRASITYHRLRDGCPCPRCIDPSTRQRTHTSPEAYNEVENSPFSKGEIGEELVRKETQDGEEGLRINWSDDHSAFYPLSRIAILATGDRGPDRVSPNAGRVLWDKQILLARQERLFVQYEDLKTLESRDSSLLKLLVQVQSFGIVLIKGVPTERTGNDDCTLREVMEWIGEIRNTFYGETWNVKNVANSKNVAYTNLNLGMHMDLLYFSSPPRFQALHCLRNRVEGGSSYFVDSFAAASKYLQLGHDHNVPIDFEYDNDSHQLQHRHRLIQGSSLQSVKSAVNWSPPFQGPPVPNATGNSPAQQKHWYTQLAAFQRIIEEPHRKWEFLMEEGDLVLFDNRRVLHARRAFRDLTVEERVERGLEVVEGEPSRWLKGCYLDGEVVWDKLVTLSRKLKSQDGRAGGGEAQSP